MDDKTRTAIMRTAIRLSEEGHKIDDIAVAITKLYPNDHLSKKSFDIAISGIEMYVSLRRAVHEAGGSGWNIDELCEMTVMDLISRLATNHIRFVFSKPNKK